jgi:hypothetical protein
VKDKKQGKQILQDSIASAIEYLTIQQRKKVLTFIILLPHQWNAVINESVKSLTEEECRQVLEYIATMSKKDGV